MWLAQNAQWTHQKHLKPFTYFNEDDVQTSIPISCNSKSSNFHNPINYHNLNHEISRLFPPHPPFHTSTITKNFPKKRTIETKTKIRKIEKQSQPVVGRRLLWVIPLKTMFFPYFHVPQDNSDKEHAMIGPNNLGHEVSERAKPINEVFKRYLYLQGLL